MCDGKCETCTEEEMQIEAILMTTTNAMDIVQIIQIQKKAAMYDSDVVYAVALSSALDDFLEGHTSSEFNTYTLEAPRLYIEAICHLLAIYKEFLDDTDAPKEELVKHAELMKIFKTEEE
jgi:hypothetical protein